MPAERKKEEGEEEKKNPSVSNHGISFQLRFRVLPGRRRCVWFWQRAEMGRSARRNPPSQRGKNETTHCRPSVAKWCEHTRTDWSVHTVHSTVAQIAAVITCDYNINNFFHSINIIRCRVFHLFLVNQRDYSFALKLHQLELHSLYNYRNCMCTHRQKLTLAREQTQSVSHSWSEAGAREREAERFLAESKESRVR